MEVTSLTLTNLKRIQETMDLIVPLDRTTNFNNFFTEITTEIDSLVAAIDENSTPITAITTSTNVKYTAAFLTYLETQNATDSVKISFEKYVNAVVWDELPADNELDVEDLVLRKPTQI